MHLCQRTVLVVILGVCCELMNDNVKPNVETPEVALTIAKASARLGSGDRVTFHCDIVLSSGCSLTVKSHYSSAFDSLDIVVVSKGGERLAQQSYAMHQSNFSRVPREFLISK